MGTAIRWLLRSRQQRVRARRRFSERHYTHMKGTRGNVTEEVQQLFQRVPG